MPHFIIDCTERVLQLQDPQKILNEINIIAMESSLFDSQDIKVRLRPYPHSLFRGKNEDFIHVFGYIMEGRTDDQKANLSKQMVTKLTELFPDVPVISMNIQDFQRSNYVNKTMI